MEKPRARPKGSMPWPVSSGFCRGGWAPKSSLLTSLSSLSPTAQDVFLLKSQPRYRSLGLEVYVTFFEIYNGKVAAGSPLFTRLGPELSKTLRWTRN